MFLSKAIDTNIDKIQQVTRLENENSVHAIPKLAELDRKSPGYLTILTAGGLLLPLALLLLTLLINTLARELPKILRTGLEFVQFYSFSLYDPPPELIDLRFERLETLPFNGPLTAGSFAYWAYWAIMIFASGAIVYRSKGLRETLGLYQDWPGGGKPGWLLRMLIWVFQGCVELGVAFLTGSFAFMALLPVLFTTLCLIGTLRDVWEHRLLILEMLGPIRQYLPLLLAVDILFVLTLTALLIFKKRFRQKFFAGLVKPGRIILGSAYLLGLGGIYLAAMVGGLMDHISETEVWFSMALLVIYPVGLAIPLSRLLFLPFSLFGGAILWTTLALQLRWRLWIAVWRQYKRNRNQVDKNTWNAVCRNHLQRCETKSARLSYYRKINYSCCPTCLDDTNLYTGVQCLALVLDQALSTITIQIGPTLQNNGLAWLHGAPDKQPPIFDALIIGQADEHDIEAFVTHYNSLYNNKSLGPYHKSLKQITARILAGHKLDDNARRILESNMGQVLDNYDPKEMPIPSTGNLRLQEAMQHESRRLKRAIRTTALAIILIIILVLVATATYFAIQDYYPEIRNEIDRWTSNQALPSTPTRRPATKAAQQLQPTQTPAPPTMTVEPSPTINQKNTLISSKDQMLMILVPTGEFLMGNPEGSRAADTKDEYPSHRVYLDAFYIDQYEVTNRQYRLCVEAGDCQPPETPKSQKHAHYYEQEEFSNYPVIKVSWFDAQNYCAWAGKRLPSEAEWEKAACWDPDTKDCTTYPWGDAKPEIRHANIARGAGDTSAVGSYPDGCSPLGICDLVGNVWEWVNDWYQENYYQDSPGISPPGPTKGFYRIIRGGSWLSSYLNATTHKRGRYNPSESRYDTGFRCALTGN